MSRRRLLANGGGSAITAPTRYQTLVSIADAGSLLAQCYPNAVYYNGITYFGYDNGDNGNIEVRTYNHATGVTSAATVVEAALEVETHDGPSLLMRASDHKLMVFYTKHGGTVCYMKVATAAESIASFGARVSLHTSIGASDYTYPSVHQLSGLANQPIYLFFRDGNSVGGVGTQAWLTYSVSTDDGATWSAKSYVHKPSGLRPYWMVRSTSTRLDVFIAQDERQSVDNVPGAHTYFDGTTWRGTNGTALTGSAPFAFSAFTLVYDGTLGSVDPMDIAYASGKPVVTWRHWKPPVASRQLDIYYARWTGSAWNVYLVLSNASTAPPVGAETVIDPSDTNTLYLDRIVSGKYEMWRYRTSDGGVSWTSQVPIKTGTTDDLTFLSGIRDAGLGLTVLWSEGTYTDFTHFDFGILGAP